MSKQVILCQSLLPNDILVCVTMLVLTHAIVVPRAHIDWAVDVEPNVEHVNIETFAEKFGYIDRRTAEEAQ